MWEGRRSAENPIPLIEAINQHILTVHGSEPTQLAACDTLLQLIASQHLDQPDLQLNCLRNRFLTLAFRGKEEEALLLNAEAMRQAAQLGEPAQHIRIAANQMRLYLLRGQPEQSFLIGQRILSRYGAEQQALLKEHDLYYNWFVTLSDLKDYPILADYRAEIALLHSEASEPLRMQYVIDFLAYYFTERGDYRQAEQLLDEANIHFATHDPNNEEAREVCLYYQTRLFLRTGRLADAHRALVGLPRSHPENILLWAEVYASLNLVDEVLEGQLEAVLAESAERPFRQLRTYWQLLGLKLRRAIQQKRPAHLNEIEQRLSHCRQLVREQFPHWEMIVQLAEAQLYRQWVELVPNKRDLLYKGVIAVQRLQQLWEDSPRRVEAHLLLADFWLRLEDYQAAQMQLAQVTQPAILPDRKSVV